MALKHFDAALTKEKNVISVDFSRATRKPPENPALAQARFTDAELTVLNEIFEQGRAAGIFNEFNISSDQCDLQEFSLFDSREDDYASPILSIYKGTTEHGDESYATLACMEEEPALFPFFNGAAQDLALRAQAIIDKEIARRSLAARTARLGRAPVPLRLVPSLKKT